MKLGIVIAKDTWHFFQEIYQTFQLKYEVEIFRQRSTDLPLFTHRINRVLFQHDMEKFLKNNDVVFFEWASDFLAFASNLPKRSRIITRLHRYEMFDWASRINWEGVDKVILVSHAMERKFRNQFPNNGGKTIVIPEGVSTERFQPIKKNFNGDIGILCHLIPRKRVYELILTFYELLNQPFNFHLHIAGDLHPAYRDYYDAMRNLVEKLGIQDKVTFYGEQLEPWNWYKNIDIFISNSYSEGLQVSPMEAMACGCYCLSHNWDGAEELLPKQNLFLTDSELRDKILSYCEMSEAQRDEQRSHLHSLVCERFDIKLISKEIEKVLDELGKEQ